MMIIDFIENHLGFCIFVSMFFAEIFSWIILRLVTDTKYLWCKRNCTKCGCWSCELWHEVNGKGV